MSTTSLPALVQSPHLNAHPAVVHGFTTRHGGLSRPPYDTLNMGLHVADDAGSVRANRQLACKALGFTLDDWVSGEQVHGPEVALVGADMKGRGAYKLNTALAGVDGLITVAPGVLLAAYFADCVPILFLDPEVPAVGIAHAGWRGTLAGIGKRMVERMSQSFGTPPERLQIWLAPAIGPCCYKVDPSLATRFMTTLPSTSPDIHPVQKRAGDYRLNLQLANRLHLQAAGVRPQAISAAEQCTGCDIRQFFSHRRLGPKTGRMAGLIGILPAAIQQDSVRLQ